MNIQGKYCLILSDIRLFFPSKNNLNNIDSSNKMDLDFKNCFMEGKPTSQNDIPYLFGYKMGIPLFRMTTNNLISPLYICCNYLS